MRVCKQRDILGMDFKDHISSPGDIWTPISRLKSVTDIRPSYRHSGEQEKKTIFYYMFPLPYDQKKKKLIIPFLVDFVLPDSWHAGKRSRFPHKKDFFEPVSPSYGSKINPNIYIWWIRFYILSNIIQETLGNVSIGMVLIKRCFVYDSSREKKKKKKKKLDSGNVPIHYWSRTYIWNSFFFVVFTASPVTSFITTFEKNNTDRWLYMNLDNQISSLSITFLFSFFVNHVNIIQKQISLQCINM